jgi:hypothetical protein
MAMMRLVCLMMLGLGLVGCPDPCVLGFNDCFIDSDCDNDEYCSLDVGGRDLCLLVPGVCVEGRRSRRTQSLVLDDCADCTDDQADEQAGDHTNHQT